MHVKLEGVDTGILSVFFALVRSIPVFLTVRTASVFLAVRTNSACILPLGFHIPGRALLNMVFAFLGVFLFSEPSFSL